MLYRICSQVNQKRTFKDKISRCRIPYRTLKEMRKLYTDENFIIIGEIGSCVKSSIDGDRLLTEAGDVIPIVPRGSLRRPFEWIAGYITVEGNIYIAVVRSLLPSLLYQRNDKLQKNNYEDRKR